MFDGYTISLVIASTLTEFELAVLKVIGISEVVFFNFSLIERVKQNKK